MEKHISSGYDQIKTVNHIDEMFQAIERWRCMNLGLHGFITRGTRRAKDHWNSS